MQRPVGGKDAAGWKLKVSLKDGGVEIRGNREGLEFLAASCLAVIDREGPANHILIDEFMYNASKGSAPLTVRYDEDLAQTMTVAATGRPIKTA